MKTVGRITATVLYAISCLYFIIFGIFNSTRFLYDILRELEIYDDYLGMNATGLYVFSRFAFIALLSCVMHMIFYPKLRKTKWMYLILSLIPAFIVLIMLMSVSYLSIGKIFILIFTSYFLFLFILAIYISKKTHKEIKTS